MSPSRHPGSQRPEHTIGTQYHASGGPQKGGGKERVLTSGSLCWGYFSVRIRVTVSVVMLLPQMSVMTQ